MTDSPPRVLCPMASGSGDVVHARSLARRLAGYRLVEYDPRSPRSVLTLLEFRRRAAGIVHASPDDAALFVSRSAKLVVTFQNYVLDPFMRGHASLAQRIHYRTLLRALTRAAVRRASAVTAVSRYTAELVRSDLGFTGPIEIIPNGVDIDTFHPPEDRADRGNLRVLFAGNVTRRKGADVLLGILQNLPEGITLVIAEGSRGLPAPFGSLRHSFESLGNVAHEDMPEVYRSVHVLVAPTLREGCSLSVLEAMASGLAVVASRVSSLPEQVVEGKGGHLCHHGRVEEFVGHLRRLAENRPVRRQMGTFNRLRAVHHFSMDGIVARYRELFDRLATG